MRRRSGDQDVLGVTMYEDEAKIPVIQVEAGSENFRAKASTICSQTCSFVAEFCLSRRSSSMTLQ